MPYIVVQSDQCPASRPWGVFRETGHQTGKTVGTPHGCHPTREQGLKQAAALYANVPDAGRSDIDAVFRWHPEAFIQQPEDTNA